MSASRTTARQPASLRLAAAPLTAGAMLGLAVSMLAPADAAAQEAAGELATVKVEDTAIDPNPNAQLGVPYKAKTSGDERRTRPIAETPTTLQVLTKSAIDDAGYSSLSEILDAQPGITLGTGENGNAFGDRYIIRGQEARSDVFVDGLRDPGMTIRESFAVEQVEITKGPSATFAGRGAAGGAVNAITKQANTAFNFGKADLAVGTDDHVRATLDVNHSFGEAFAVRGNLLYAREDVPERSPANRERTGLALSGLYAPTDKLTVTVDYYGLRAEDLPDLGSWLYNKQPNKHAPVYAQSQDFLKSDVDTFTARVDYSFSDAVRLKNLLRYGKSDNSYLITGARGTLTSANAPGGAYLSATLSTHQGWQEVEYLANQTDLFIDAELFGLKHQLVAGLEYTDHKVLNGVFANTNTGAFNCASGTSTPLNAYCIYDRTGAIVPNLSTLMGRKAVKGTWDTDWGVKTLSAYLMDTVDLTDKLTLFGGVRVDSFDFDLATQNTTTLARADYAYSDTLWNGHLGVTYDLAPGLMVYASAASGADINGGESDVGTSSGYGGTVIYNGKVAGAKPEKSLNLELGAKWNVLDERLLLTAAAFQSTKKEVMEGADYSSVGTFNTGKNRVRGVELGVSGQITDALSVVGGVTWMEAEVLASATPANVGKTLSNFADVSASLQAKYEIREGFYVGGVIKHEGKRYGGQPDTAAAYSTTDGTYSQPVPAYTTLDLFATYRINKDLQAKVNLGNVTDENYYLAVYRSGAFLYKGDGRNARLTLTYEF